MAYIRDTYKVPAFPGGRVEYTGKDDGPVQGVITGAKNGHITIRLDGQTASRRYHPTWKLRYLDAQETP